MGWFRRWRRRRGPEGLNAAVWDRLFALGTDTSQEAALFLATELQDETRDLHGHFARTLLGPGGPLVDVRYDPDRFREVLGEALPETVGLEAEDAGHDLFRRCTGDLADEAFADRLIDRLFRALESGHLKRRDRRAALAVVVLALAGRTFGDWDPLHIPALECVFLTQLDETLCASDAVLATCASPPESPSGSSPPDRRRPRGPSASRHVRP